MADDNKTQPKRHLIHPLNDREKFVQDVENVLMPAAKNDPVLQKRLDDLDSTKKQVDENNTRAWYKRILQAPISQKKLPWGVKILAALCLVVTALAMVSVARDIVETVGLFANGGIDKLGTSTVVVTWIHLIVLVLLDAAFFIVGINLLRGRRVFAALIIYAIYILLLSGAVCSLMLYGVTLRLVVYGAMFGLLVAFQVYLDPYLREERQLQRLLRDNEIKHAKEEGTLGRDMTGKGYIELNFFNLFWIFVVASIIGDVMESIYHVTVVDPGHWQDRAGLLFGPFSPIYGFGALLMTLFLNRLYRKNVVLIFFASAIIGGAFEYVVSVWMQYTYGAVAWDYTGQWLSIGGRTCGWAMCAWGLLGVAWIRLILPMLLWLINKIPWNWRYTVTTIAAALMAVDCVMTLESLDCWYERLSNQPINTPIQDFYATYFNNDYMANRFQSMSIDPNNAVRGNV